MEASEAVFKHNCAKQERTEFWWGRWPRLLEKQSILHCMEGLKSAGSTLSWHIEVMGFACMVWRFPQAEKKKEEKENKQKCVFGYSKRERLS